jgi:hypothetical protein
VKDIVYVNVWRWKNILATRDEELSTDNRQE